MIADLHTHTTASDGILRPHELVSRAKLSGVELLAITDHDTVAGLAEAEHAAKQAGIQLVNGIEFSCEWAGRSIHIVGLNLDITNTTLLTAIKQQAAVRSKRALIIAERLEKIGVTDAYLGAKEIAGQAEIGRPHFAKHMVNIGFVKSVEQAFKRYLGNGKIGDVKQDWMTIDSAVCAICAAGGRAVFAHPDKYKQTRTKLRQALGLFKEAGGHGIEVISGQQTSNITRDMTQLCQQYDLLASCGSDFHEPTAGWQALGAFGKLPTELTPIWHDWARAA